MKYHLTSKLKIFGMHCLQIFLFLLPFLVLVIVYQDKFISKDTGAGLSGLAILGLIIYVLGAKKILGKLPKILWFVILWVLFLCMNFLSEFLLQIGSAMLIGAAISLPLNIPIHAMKVDSETDLIENSKRRSRERANKKKVKVSIEE